MEMTMWHVGYWTRELWGNLILSSCCLFCREEGPSEWGGSGLLIFCVVSPLVNLEHRGTWTCGSDAHIVSVWLLCIWMAQNCLKVMKVVCGLEIMAPLKRRKKINKQLYCPHQTSLEIRVIIKTTSHSG